MPKWWNWFGRGRGMGRGPGWGRGWGGRGGPGPCWWMLMEEKGVTPPTPQEIERELAELPPFWGPGRGWWFWYYYMKEKEKNAK